MTKHEIRKAAENARSRLTPTAWGKYSAAIEKRVLSADFYQNAQIVFCYASFRREADTWGILERILRDGKRLLVPRTLKDGQMLAVEIKSLDDLVPGRFGLREPASRLESDLVPDLVLVPGVAFSPAGDRVGFGKGYYDRCLSKYPEALRAALCFEVQLFEDIPAEAFDIPMDLILTEKREIVCSKGRG